MGLPILSVIEPKKFTQQNVRTKKNTIHITLNFSPRESLSTNLLQQISKDYMENIGLGNQPFLVYQHFDTAHQHIHIASVNIAKGGKRISIYEITNTRLSFIKKEIEKHYGLIRAEDQKNNQSLKTGTFVLKRIIYGKTEKKEAIRNVVQEIIKGYKFGSFSEFNAVLNQFGVYADRGKPGSLMYINGGLVYGLLDAHNQNIGVRIKASEISTHLLLRNVQKVFAQNKQSRKPYVLRIKYLIDQALEKSQNRSEIENRLRNQGIRIIFRKTTQGDTIGVTFIDNATRVVINGHTLGKKYYAKAIVEAIDQKFRLLNPTEDRFPDTEKRSYNQTAEVARQPEKREAVGAGLEVAGEAEAAAATSVTTSASSTQADSLEDIPCLDLPVIDMLVDRVIYEDEEDTELISAVKKGKNMKMDKSNNLTMKNKNNKFHELSQ